MTIEIIKKELPELSVIIPFHGEKKYLEKCLEGMLNQKSGLKYEIIVVESENKNDIKDLACSYPNIIFISSDTLLYPGRARNLGVNKSNSEFLAFIDADCIPETDWASNIFSSLNDGYDIVLGPILNLYPAHPIASVDNLLVFPDFQKSHPSKSFIHFPPCNLGITKKLFIESGGFPEEIKIGEDTKFSRSVLRKCNPKIIYNNKIIVRHSGRKNFVQFMKHQQSFGYNRGYSDSKKNIAGSELKKNFLYSFFYGCRRRSYIFIRTLQ
ncbi:MAG: glycosyltransferase, partial [Candidatus Thorarchaeota archaeon]